ncbi:MAG: sialate O-acetylesterase [Verrucomicrobia bacterium]|nr:sialate O-acetylesterase [Verrucomicrobiota bacterium]
MKTPATLLCFAAAFCLGPLSASADVKLPAIFSDHMVLQCDVEVPVWGWAEPGEQVTVTVTAGANKTSESKSATETRVTSTARSSAQTHSVTADASGKWTVKLSKLHAGDHVTLTVNGKNSITISDVLVGEVWLGSGQSNMALTVNRAKDYEQEQKAANLPEVRMFKEESAAATTEQTEGKGNWVICAPDTVGGFSAALFFFGREIHKSLGVPVGLINSSVGGTPIESWIAPETQRASAELKPFFDTAAKDKAGVVTEAAKKKYEKDLAKWTEDAKQARAEKQKAPKKPLNPADVKARKGNIGGLFNGKIAPLIPYAIRGALWYQGEANSAPTKAVFYEAQLKLLVTDWRARWGYEFPMAWAQLPNFDGGTVRDWPLVREAMLKTLALPKTGMGINIDIGEAKNIHPANKQEVGRRLSLWALGTVYGKKVPATSGPLPAGHLVHGGEIILSFSHTDGGLVAKDGALKGFVVAGDDKQWKPATARIEGDKVIVPAPDVKAPLAARYAWENFPTCNLYNGASLPATPFRTDDWK